MRIEEIRDAILIWGIPPKDWYEKKEINTIKGVTRLLIVPEMRPFMYGLEISRILQENNTEHVYVTDNMLGILFYMDKIKKIFFFYKKIDNGRLIGIPGSLYVVTLAKLHDVPIVAKQGEDHLEITTKLSLDEFIKQHFPNAVYGTADEIISVLLNND